MRIGYHTSKRSVLILKRLARSRTHSPLVHIAFILYPRGAAPDGELRVFPSQIFSSEMDKDICALVQYFLGHSAAKYRFVLLRVCWACASGVTAVWWTTCGRYMASTGGILEQRYTHKHEKEVG